MKLKDQVCTLKQAKRLKELGIAQESFFYHIEVLDMAHVIPEKEIWNGIVAPSSAMPFKQTRNQCSAFTVSELGVMLPDFVALEELGTLIIHKGVTHKKHKKWSCHYFGLTKKVVEAVFGYSQRDVMAAMLIFLLENNLITPEEVNARLNA